MQPQFAFRTPAAVIVTAPSKLGHLAVAVADEKIVGTSMAHDSGPQAANRLAKMLGASLEAETLDTPADANERLACDVLDRLVRFCEGEPVVLDNIPVALDHLSAFQRRVVRACRAIPYGATRSYGEVAAAAGSAGAARAVGQVMASNRMPLIVPCHRVVAAGGKLGGFSAPQGLTLKKRLLSIEASGGGILPRFENSRTANKRTAAAARK
jgi:methylated-DNA-[protein]-cysteine S-methyltransferase